MAPSISNYKFSTDTAVALSISNYKVSTDTAVTSVKNNFTKFHPLHRHNCKLIQAQLYKIFIYKTAAKSTCFCTNLCRQLWLHQQEHLRHLCRHSCGTINTQLGSMCKVVVSSTTAEFCRQNSGHWKTSAF